MRVFLCWCITDCCMAHKKTVILIGQILTFLYTLLLVFMTTDKLSYKHHLILVSSFFVLMHGIFLAIIKIFILLFLVFAMLLLRMLFYPFYLILRCFG